MINSYIEFTKNGLEYSYFSLEDSTVNTQEVDSIIPYINERVMIAPDVTLYDIVEILVKDHIILDQIFLHYLRGVSIVDIYNEMLEDYTDSTSKIKSIEFKNFVALYNIKQENEKVFDQYSVFDVIYLAAESEPKVFTPLHLVHFSNLKNCLVIINSDLVIEDINYEFNYENDEEIDSSNSEVTYCIADTFLNNFFKTLFLVLCQQPDRDEKELERGKFIKNQVAKFEKEKKTNEKNADDFLSEIKRTIGNERK